MKVKALVNFSGLISMSKGETKDIKEKEIYQDLLDSGYVQKVEGKRVNANEN